MQIDPEVFNVDTIIKIEASLNNYRTVTGELQWFNIDGSEWSSEAQGTQASH